MVSGIDSPIVAPLAAEFCSNLPLERGARELLRDGFTAADFVSVLNEAQLHKDAATVLAFLLPQRESIWWGCQCARQSVAQSDSSEGLHALESAERWVTEMTEEARRTAETAAREAGMSTAGGCLAFAAFYTGGSIAPVHTDAAPPAPEVTPQFVVAAVLVSALADNPNGAPEKYRVFLKQGLELYKASTGQ